MPIFKHMTGQNLIMIFNPLCIYLGIIGVYIFFILLHLSLSYFHLPHSFSIDLRLCTSLFNRHGTNSCLSDWMLMIVYAGTQKTYQPTFISKIPRAFSEYVFHFRKKVHGC